MAAGGSPPASYAPCSFSHPNRVNAVNKTPAEITHEYILMDLEVEPISDRRKDLQEVKQLALSEIETALNSGQITDHMVISSVVGKALVENMPKQPKYRLDDFTQLHHGRAGNYCFLGGPKLNSKYGLIADGTRNDVVYKTPHGYLLVRDSDRKFIYIPNTWRSDVSSRIKPSLGL